jgi:Cu(I)/Ag(I) efflux system membrane fusion protein
MSAAKTIWGILALAAALAVGVGLGRYDWPPPPWERHAEHAGDETPLEHAVAHLESKYTCPMHPQIVRDQPGQCPICGMDLVPVEADPGAAAAASVVTIAPEVMNNLGVRTAQASRGDVSRRIDTLGFVDYDEERLVHVHVREEGWVETLAVRSVGEPVKQGQLLFELYAPNVLKAQDDYLQVLRSGEAELMRIGRSRLEKLGMSADQIEEVARTRRSNPRLRVLAPRDGIVTELRIREGQFVQPMTDAVLISDLSEVWVMAEVYERQMSWVRAGAPAEAVLPGRPGEVFEGKVDYVYPTVDMKTRNLRVRLRIPNPKGELKPGMYADVVIFGGKKGGVLTVPREAVIRESGQDRVILALGEGRFQPRNVRLGIETADRVEILEGLQDGEEVVVSAQFLIDSEASRRASLLRMQPAGGAGHAGHAH